MEIVSKSVPNFLEETFDIRMTGEELSIVYALLSQSSTTRIVQDIEGTQLKEGETLIAREKGANEPSYKMYLALDRLLTERNQLA